MRGGCPGHTSCPFAPPYKVFRLGIKGYNVPDTQVTLVNGVAYFVLPLGEGFRGEAMEVWTLGDLIELEVGANLGNHLDWF